MSYRVVVQIDTLIWHYYANVWDDYYLTSVRMLLMGFRAVRIYKGYDNRDLVYELTRKELEECP